MYHLSDSYHQSARPHQSSYRARDLSPADYAASAGGTEADRLAGLPRDLPSTRSPLYAVSDLMNYEMLKKQNEESLKLLSTLEATIQNKLDKFTASSPLEVCSLLRVKILKYNSLGSVL